MAGRRDEQVEGEAQEWMEAIMDEEFPGDFEESLADGVLLIRFLNTLRPKSVRRYNDPVRLPIHGAENVSKYLTAVRKHFGVDEYQMFSTADLTEGKNVYQVASHLHAFGRTLQKKVEDEGFPWKEEWPTLGVKETKANKRTFTEAQLRRAAAAPSILNMGASDMGRQMSRAVVEGRAGKDLPCTKQAGGGAKTGGAKAGGGKAGSSGGSGAPQDAKAAAKAAWKAKMAAKKAGGSEPAAPAASGGGGLPDGWETLYTDDGTAYYFNASSGETQWEAPTADGGGGGGLPAGWEELTTEDGTVYYSNTATGETQWEKPSGGGSGDNGGGGLPAGWEELTTEDGTVYYSNTATGETQWEKPSGGGSGDNGGGGLPAGWEELTTEDGTVYYSNTATGETQWEMPSGGGGLPDGWETLYTEDGTAYYSNTATGETQWEPPT